MLKKVGIGCGGLVAIIVVIAIIIAVAGGGNGGSQSTNQVDEMPPTPPPLVNAREIWREYEENETRANNEWKGIWLRVQLDTIDEIESGGKVQMYMDSAGFKHIEFDFDNDNDVVRLNRGESITAICRLSGFELDSWLNFKNCRFP